jgi:putative zinc finger protein
MNCNAVRSKLPGYLDDGLTGSARVSERVKVREHLDGCANCREELQRFRKLGVLLSSLPKHLPPADLAVRIRVAAAKRQASAGWRARAVRVRNRVEILLDNVFRPITVPATGGFVSAILVFVLVFQILGPGLTASAVQNDVPLNLMRPAELLSLSEYPPTWAPEHDGELEMPHGLLVDVTVDAQGGVAGYQILSGPRTNDMQHQLDQVLMFSRFTPMLSFGRPTSGGHVILSFSAVHVRG